MSDQALFQNQLKLWELECYYHKRGFNVEKYNIVAKYIKEWTRIR